MGQFFRLLGFEEDKSVVIKGPQFSTYMGVDGIEAEHVTLALANVSPRTEVQLLKYHHPNPLPDSAIGNLTQLGFNHICFTVDDLEAEVEGSQTRLPFRAGRHHRGTGGMGLTPKHGRP